MPGFNPDEYLKQPVGNGFNPDDYLAQSMEDDPSLNYYREQAVRPQAQGREAQTTSFNSDNADRNQIEYENYLQSIGRGGNTKYLDPTILGEVLRGKLTGNYSHTEEDDTSKAFKRGAVQGATFNFGDEIEGSAKQLIDGEQYEKARDVARAEDNRLKEVSPNAYMTGEIAGAIAVPVPGMSSAKLGTKVLSGMAQGGLDAYGRNENPDDLIRDVGTGLAIGGAVPTVLTGAGAGVKRLKELMPRAEQIRDAGNTAKNRAISLMFDIPEKDVDDILRNPEKVRNALTLPEIAERIPESMSILNKTRSELNERAMSLLDDSKQFGHQNKTLEGFIDNVQNTMMTETRNGMIPIGLAEEKVIRKLDEFKEVVNRYDDVVSEKQVKRLIQSLTEEIDSFDKIENTLMSNKLKNVRFQMNDLLKSNNTAYAKAMEPFEKIETLAEKIQSDFGLARGKDGVEGLVATDRTLSKLKNMLSDNKAFSQERAKEYARLTGQDVLDEVNTSRLNSSLEKATTNGSRKTNLGIATGGAIGTGIGSTIGAPLIGGTIGAGIGAVVGYSADKYGRQVAKKYLLSGGNPTAYVNRFQGTRYFRPLQEAMKRGNKSLAITHYLLSKTDENFRKMNEDKE